MLEFLPEIGGVAAGALVAAVIELGKAFGFWNEDHAGLIVVVFAAAWAGLIAAQGQWPAAEAWIVLAIRVVALLLSVPVGAKVGYESAVKPVVRKRWNKK